LLRGLEKFIDRLLPGWVAGERFVRAQAIERLFRRSAHYPVFGERCESNRLIERAGVFGEEFQDWDESSV